MRKGWAPLFLQKQMIPSDCCKESTETVLKTTEELSMWYHFRKSRFLHHTNKKITQELEHVAWAGPDGNKAKHNTPGCTGVVLYFSFRAELEIIYFWDHRTLLWKICNC